MKIPAVAQYDPSGLRSTMTANWPALEKSLAENAVPDHLPLPEWFSQISEIHKECDRKGIPHLIGKPYAQNRPASYTKIKW